MRSVRRLTLGLLVLMAAQTGSQQSFDLDDVKIEAR